MMESGLMVRLDIYHAPKEPAQASLAWRESLGKPVIQPGFCVRETKRTVGGCSAQIGTGEAIGLV
jgi:hypothetical protein